MAPTWLTAVAWTYLSVCFCCAAAIAGDIFWFLMQVGMMVGFATSWPANVWLVNRGIKIPM
jgi:hypothetical protein